ncbi:MAG: hypothetical protein Fur0032_23150 [Terrimicrobiaceae bacterium]
MKHRVLVALTLMASSLPIFAESPIGGAALVKYGPNPTGFDTGFWANYRRSADVVRDFGPRPLERVNFHKWRQHEKKKGAYNFEHAFRWESWAHLAGSTAITNLNTFFTKKLNPDGMDCIPEFYPQNIDDPETREAARNYLRAAVRELLEQTGTAWLALDYEMLWFALPTKPEVRESYRAWFVESAALCREVAAEMGMSERLKIGCIVNTDPYDTARHSIGSPASPHHEPQQWLLDCFAAADFIGFDTYAGGATGEVTPDAQLRGMRFWLKNYVGDKPFYITESGFTTSVEQGYKHKGYHIRGTEAQQAGFFTAMFQALTGARQNPADPLSRVRGYLIWKYADRGYQEDPVEQFFGLVRQDGSRKPAHAAVAAELARIDADPTLSATQVVEKQDLTDEVLGGEAFWICRDGGHKFDTVELRLEPGPAGKLVVNADTPVCLITRLGGGPWITTAPEPCIRPSIEIPARDRETTLQIQFTAAKYPLKTQITSIRFEPNQP